MPTPAEQKALAFVALVVLIGGTVRIVRGGVLGPSTPTAAEQQALARQSFSAGSSASQLGNNGGRAKKGRKVARDKRDTVAVKSGNGAQGGERDWRGLPPPSPRIDVIAQSARAVPGPFSTGRPIAPSVSSPIDLDRATAAEIEALPRVGPALARRIVVYRDSAGPFGSIEALRRIRGLGPATLKLLAPLVTFSGQARR
jgi:DNA uptake protein ComE-like DNA-binding protein